MIDYAPVTPQRGRIPKWSVPAWLLVSFVLWLVMDWRVYVAGPPREPKFTLPLWYQVTESLVLGAIAVAALILLTPLVRRFRSKLRGAHAGPQALCDSVGGAGDRFANDTVWGDDMNGTHLTWRQGLMVVLVFVMFFGALFAYAFTAFPSNNEPVASRRIAIGSGVAAALAAVWFAKLLADSIRDRRRGIVRAPAKIGGRFHLWFGAATAAAGVAGSVLTYNNAVAAGGGTWTLYTGLIAWGVIHMFIGWRKISRPDPCPPPLPVIERQNCG